MTMTRLRSLPPQPSPARPTSTASPSEVGKATAGTPRIQSPQGLRGAAGSHRAARQVAAAPAAPQWSAPPRAAASDMPTASPDAPSNSILRARPDVQQAANTWMQQQIRHQLGPVIDPSQFKLVAFSSPQAAAALDTRYLVSEIGLDELPLRQRQTQSISLTAEGRQLGIYDEQDVAGHAGRFSVTAGDDQAQEPSVPRSRFPAALLLDAMNGFSQHPANELGSLFQRHHLPLSPAYKREYVRDYVRNVTGQDVDPETTYLLEFTPPADQAPDASAGTFGQADIKGGNSLMELFEKHTPPAHDTPAVGERFRVLDLRDLNQARHISNARGKLPIGEPATWARQTLQAAPLLEMMGNVPAEQQFTKTFVEEQLSPYWEKHQDQLVKLDRARAYTHAQQAYDAGRLSAQQFGLLHRVFTQETRPEDVQVYPINFAALPSTPRFVGMRIEHPGSGLKLLYFPEGTEAIRAFPRDPATGEAGQLEQMQQWLAGKVGAASWRSAVTSAHSAAPPGPDAQLDSHLDDAAQVPLEGDVFRALNHARIELEMQYPEAFARRVNRPTPLESVPQQWRTIDDAGFAAMTASEQRDVLLDQYPPLREIASEYARDFLLKHFNQDLNPDTTYLTAFPEKSFIIETIDRIGSGRLGELLSGANGNPASTVELARSISLTDLFLQNWDPHDALLLGWQKSGLLKILSDGQIAREGEKHNYRNAVNVIDPSELFSRMMAPDGKGNEFASTYGALLDSYWRTNAGHIASHARRQALQLVENSADEIGAFTLDQQDRNTLRELFNGQSGPPAQVKVSALKLLGNESLNAMVIEDAGAKRNYLYLPGAPDQQLRAFAQTDSMMHWLVANLESQPWREQFLRHSFSRVDREKLQASVETLITRLPDRYDARRAQAGKYQPLEGDPFERLTALSATKDISDLQSTSRDNQRLRTAATVDFFTNLQLPFVGNIATLAAGDEPAQGSAQAGLAYEIAGLALGLGVGRVVGMALKPLVGAALRSTVTNLADTAVGLSIPLAADHFTRTGTSFSTPLQQHPPGLAPLAPERRPPVPATNPYLAR